ncbi:hypothetical protein PRIPAC_74284 [Pristionchus pacificus]|uniref:Uncharacterized protein n=1 Tax=Pristionchus pacificus TaxID=54126 RepID=A0A2A6CSN5_PRIPA|nr:hypothetical protein PRIPAC_74284 [Pristionchus pacificus]|eukprot:PDM81096.1 hypothetical protein PRIPAC_36099 [Pristionchus pacificus]
MILRLAILSTIVAATVDARVDCPAGPNGRSSLTCAFECCKSLEGQTSDYYCCGLEEHRLVKEGVTGENGRAERFVAYGNTFQVDYTMLLLGLIISIVVSILLSFFCCLLCNGCWLHRRRNPQEYESVHDNGFYPICCGFGLPLGTVVFSSHPPQYRGDESDYQMSTSSTSSKNRVRFNPDGTPRGVLKNNGDGNGYDRRPY